MAKPAKSIASKGRKRRAPAANPPPKRDQVHFGKHKRFGQGGKDGIFFSWAGGIAHPHTAYRVSLFNTFRFPAANLLEAVPFVEKLRSVKMEHTPEIDRLEKFLESLRSDGVSKTLQDQQFNVIEDSEERIVHTFNFEGRSGKRIKFKNISRHGNNPFAGTKVALEVVEKVLKKTTPPPSKKLVQYVMATLLGDKGVPKNKEGKFLKEKLRVTRSEAQDVVAERRNERAVLEAEMEEAIRSQPSVVKLMDEIQKEDHFRGDPFEQQYHDEVAADDSSILEQIDEQIVLVVDKDDEAIAFFMAMLFQRLYSEEMVSEVLKAFRLWSYHQAFLDPRKDCRHPLHAKFLRDHPQFDVTKAADPHHVSATIAHDGSHATLSDHDGHNIMLTPDSRLNRHMNLDGGIPKLYRAVCQGPYAIVTDVAKFGFRALLPELYQEYVEVQQNTDRAERIDTREEEPFGLRARLTNVLTGDHKDSGDWHGGIAALVPFGKFEGLFHFLD